MALETGLTMKTLFSPDDDTAQAFVDFLKGAQKSLHVAIYGFHLPAALDVLLQKHKEGVEVCMVCDHTQARGTYERPEIQQLRDAGVEVHEGTSQKHRIMHHKFVVRDGDSVLAGSWNFSESASEESNYFDIVTNKDRAALFLSKWQEMKAFISTYEEKWNEPEKE